MPNYLKPEGNPSIPVQLTESEFNKFILERIPARTRGPQYKVSRYKIFNYILKFLYMGCQWKMLPIDKDETGHSDPHYSQVFRTFQKWLNGDTILNVFENSVLNLHHENLLDTTVTHGDGTTTMAKKGGNCLGYIGNKHMKREKVVAFVDSNCNVLSPMTIAPGNCHEDSLFGKAFAFLKDIQRKSWFKTRARCGSPVKATNSFQIKDTFEIGE